MIKINQYLSQREEETLLKLKTITGDNFHEYITEIKKIKDKNTYELILPFIEYIIDLILSGINVTPDGLSDWWIAYSNSLQYKSESLKYATNTLCYDISESFTKAFKVNIFTRFVRWIGSKIKTR